MGWNPFKAISKAIDKVGDAVEKGVKAVVDTAKGVVTSAVDAVKGVGAVVGALAKGDIKGAFTAAVGVLGNVANVLFTVATPALSIGSAFVAGAVGGKAGQIMGDLLGGPKALLGNVLNVAANEVGTQVVRGATGGPQMPQMPQMPVMQPMAMTNQMPAMHQMPMMQPMDMGGYGPLDAGMGSVALTRDPSQGMANANALPLLQQAQQMVLRGDYAGVAALLSSQPNVAFEMPHSSSGGSGFAQPAALLPTQPNVAFDMPYHSLGSSGPGSVMQTRDPSLGLSNVIALPLLQQAQQLALRGDYAGIEALLNPQPQPVAAEEVEVPVHSEDSSETSVRSGESEVKASDTGDAAGDAAKSGEEKPVKSGDDKSTRSVEDKPVKASDDTTVKASDDTTVKSDKSEAEWVGKGVIETPDASKPVKSEPEKSVEQA